MEVSGQRQTAPKLAELLDECVKELKDHYIEVISVVTDSAANIWFSLLSHPHPPQTLPYPCACHTGTSSSKIFEKLPWAQRFIRESHEIVIFVRNRNLLISLSPGSRPEPLTTKVYTNLPRPASCS